MRHGMVVLLAAWMLNAGTSTNKSSGPNDLWSTEKACVAEAKRRVEIGKRAKANAEAEGRAFARAHHLDPNHIGSWTDYNVTWECREMKPGGRVVKGP
jgi:hypothetical protein